MIMLTVPFFLTIRECEVYAAKPSGDGVVTTTTPPLRAYVQLDSIERIEDCDKSPNVCILGLRSGAKYFVPASRETLFKGLSTVLQSMQRRAELTSPLIVPAG
jgi:hypothetical protein